ncbi:MAG: methyltransferase domain-containing protein [Elusimicrobiota bacterium]|jgi:SAM-dependent methyltransferase
MKKDWWKTFFNRADFPIEQLVDPAATRTEVRSLLRLMRLPRGSRVLDLCCGMGRHSIPLSRAGLKVTGYDYSKDYLRAARAKAGRKAGALEFVHGDMRSLPYEREFDAVINLWTSFSYFPRLSDDRKVLSGVRRVLKPLGRFFLEMIDGSRVLRSMPAQTSSCTGRLWCLEEHRVRRGADPAVLSKRLFVDPDGNVRGGETFSRIYTFSRLRSELHRAGFVNIRISGGLLELGKKAGARHRILAVAQRPA